MRIRVRTKDLVVDERKLRRKIRQTSTRPLLQQAQYIRVRARSEMKKRTQGHKPKPGGYPRVTSRKSPLRKLLIYAYDRAREEALVGALDFKGGKSLGGGAAALVRGGRVQKLSHSGKRKTIRVRKFPFMQLAEKAERPGFEKRFGNIFK